MQSSTIERQELLQRIESGQVIFGQCTANKSRQFARKVMVHFEASIANLQIKGTQFALLGCVLQHGPLKASQLAKHMELSPSTLSRNLQPLIARGLLVMTEGVDARSRLLSLTSEGEKMWVSAAGQWQDAQKRLGQLLGVGALATLHGLLDSANKGLMR
jgi:DNA-binding MarR family transcriptional regulator